MKTPNNINVCVFLFLSLFGTVSNMAIQSCIGDVSPLWGGVDAILFKEIEFRIRLTGI